MVYIKYELAYTIKNYFYINWITIKSVSGKNMIVTNKILI